MGRCRLSVELLLRSTGLEASTAEVPYKKGQDAIFVRAKGLELTFGFVKPTVQTKRVCLEELEDRKPVGIPDSVEEYHSTHSA